MWLLFPSVYFLVCLFVSRSYPGWMQGFVLIVLVGLIENSGALEAEGGIDTM